MYPIVTQGSAAVYPWRSTRVYWRCFATIKRPTVNEPSCVASFVEVLAHVFSRLHFSKVEAHHQLPHAKLGHTGPCLLR